MGREKERHRGRQRAAYARTPRSASVRAVKILIVATIALGLLVDQRWASHGQAVASAATWMVCVVLWSRGDARQRAALVACLVFATAGEVFLSLGWGLYRYRLGNIPLFVPPGHVLLFYLGTQLALRIPERAEWGSPRSPCPWWRSSRGTGATRWDRCSTRSSSRACGFRPRAGSTRRCSCSPLAMELYGTWLGNWAWSARVPWLGLTAANPAARRRHVLLRAGPAGVERDAGDRIAARPGLPVLQPPASPGLNPSVASHQAATRSACSSSR